MGYGLSRAKIEVVKRDDHPGASADKIRKQINSVSRWSRWDYEESAGLCRWLAEHGYPLTAACLADRKEDYCRNFH